MPAAVTFDSNRWAKSIIMTQDEKMDYDQLLDLIRACRNISGLADIPVRVGDRCKNYLLWSHYQQSPKINMYVTHMQRQPS